MERLEPKAPTEIRNYSFDWSSFLGTDTITSSDVQVEGVTLVNDTNDTTSVTVTVSGGLDGTVARILNIITTAGGLEVIELFTLPIMEASEPVTVNEAKWQLNIVDDDSDDALIASYIRSARAYVESESGYVFVRRQFAENLSSWPSFLSISRRPLISVDSVDYIDSNGAPQTLDDAEYYTALALRRITPVSTWPTLGKGGSISITYTAGFAEGEQAEELELARQAIFLLVGHWYANREAVSIDQNQPAEVPFAARALIDRFRAQVV
jgi:uncharacterized phiE125 gp8 family phage protein